MRSCAVGNAGCAEHGLHGLRGLDVLGAGEAVRPSAERVRCGRVVEGASGNVARAAIHRSGELRGRQVRRGSGRDHAVQGGVGVPGSGGGAVSDVWVGEERGSEG